MLPPPGNTIERVVPWRDASRRDARMIKEGKKLLAANRAARAQLSLQLLALVHAVLTIAGDQRNPAAQIRPSDAAHFLFSFGSCLRASAPV